jgi:hypothetical protein
MNSPLGTWMRQAEHPQRGTMFIDRGTRIFRGSASLHHAQKWTRPEVGPGSEKSRRARGQQWRLVMAYAGFEIFAKALQGNFAAQGGSGVSDFLKKLGNFSLEKVTSPISGSPPRGKTIEELLDFLHAPRRDQELLEAWLSSAESRAGIFLQSRAEGISLARIIRNLTAHGILSASLVQRLNIPRLCDALTNTLFETSRHALSKSTR